jgi:hypothetical protein
MVLDEILLQGFFSFLAFMSACSSANLARSVEDDPGGPPVPAGSTEPTA